jgi:hypothetical protein
MMMTVNIITQTRENYRALGGMLAAFAAHMIYSTSLIHSNHYHHAIILIIIQQQQRPATISARFLKRRAIRALATAAEKEMGNKTIIINLPTHA